MTGTVLVSQMGARMHYAVPRIFHESGELEALYTDICGVKDWPRLLRRLPQPLLTAPFRRLAGRIPQHLPAEKIVTFPMRGAYLVAQRMLVRDKSREMELTLKAARSFSRAVVRQGFGHAKGFYGIAGECLEQLTAARRQGLWTAVEQIVAPREVLEKLVEHERRKFPDWGEFANVDPFATEFAEREKAEWAAADLVVCPSEFVRQGVIEVGGPARKCVVVPYGIDSGAYRALPPRLPSSKLRVLTIGAVGLRKGSPYVLEAARQMELCADFRMCGPVHVGGRAEQELRRHVDVRGIVPRAEIHRHFAWADVFLLPTVCEGSATVTYEALAAGLPVVTTPNAGSVVTDGEDGFVLDLGNVGGIVDSLKSLHADRKRLAAMSAAAICKAADYDIGRYAERLRSAVAPLARSSEYQLASRPVMAAGHRPLAARS